MWVPISKAVVVGVVAAPFYAYALWLIWQGAKIGTILKRGAWTGRNGTVCGFFGFVAISAAITFVSLYLLSLAWFTLLALLTMFQLGERLARKLEGVIYATEAELDAPFRFLNSIPYKTRDDALDGLNKVYPFWWVKKMPQQWRLALQERLRRYCEERFA